MNLRHRVADHRILVTRPGVGFWVLQSIQTVIVTAVTPVHPAHYERWKARLPLVINLATAGSAFWSDRPARDPLQTKMPDMPAEIVQRIFMLLAEDLKIIFAMESVCHSWRSILAEPETWNAMYHSRWCLDPSSDHHPVSSGNPVHLNHQKEGCNVGQKIRYNFLLQKIEASF